MPTNPDEVATVTAGGSIFSQWEWLEVERRIGTPITHIRLRVMELGSSSPANGWSTLRLTLGDEAAVSLAGQDVIAGDVTVRQIAADANSHMIEIIVSSKPWPLLNSTPEGAGQFKNASLQQIANAITSPYGIGFTVQNAPSAAKPFERVSVHTGETCFQILERLCRMRDVHLVDDKDGNLIALRADLGAPNMIPTAQIVEGKNIEAIRGVMSMPDASNKITSTAQNFGNDNHWGAQSLVSATVFNPQLARYSPLLFQAEMPGDAFDMVMRANHELAANLATMVEVFVTVPGWLKNDGSLWIDHVGQIMSVYSPMMFPDNEEVLALRGVKHMQSNEAGTSSILEFCLPNALSAGGRVVSSASAESWLTDAQGGVPATP